MIKYSAMFYIIIYSHEMKPCKPAQWRPQPQWLCAVSSSLDEVPMEIYDNKQDKG